MKVLQLKKEKQATKQTTKEKDCKHDPILIHRRQKACSSWWNIFKNREETGNTFISSNHPLHLHGTFQIFNALYMRLPSNLYNIPVK